MVGIWHLACQTYALNLIDSHSGQNRAPQLFSSPKSFRVAKSTPSSAKSLAKLSPISKWLSKPPLLSKSALVLAPLLLLPYTQGAQALTAQTSRVIEGSAPYLTFDGGQTKATNTDTFLAIELPDGRRITPSTNTSSRTNPIMLINGRTFNDIHMVIPSGAASTSLSSLISQGKWGDDDGDGQGAGGVTASGSMSLTIKDINSTAVSRSDTLSICNAPYAVTLSSTGGNLVTQYGVPNSSTFSGGRATYYIMPSQPEICSVRPNLLYGGTTGIDSRDNPRHAGPANIWNPSKGFLVQSTSSSSYGRNFPTTGADGLYFDLDMGGVDGSQLRWTVNTSGSITATVSWTRPLTGRFTTPNGSSSEADRWITDKSKYVTRVTLHGPEARSQWNDNNPSQITVPSLPQTFELVGRDSNGHEVKYGFVLKQWFVNRGDRRASVLDQTTWCNNLGYRLSAVRDLSNATWGWWVNAIPTSSGNYYKRNIGAGLFTEWGYMRDYVGAGFEKLYSYWTPESNGGNYAVDSENGYGRIEQYNSYVACTTP
ncbi:hypothetical protein GQ596_04955 [Gilliamella sp. Pra-s60]|uniref:hypothetical protein n=1 Tax=Gilliamella sp. Pra-s60 TaxID=2687315 RepID=UPI00132453B7|nr:hypothetical protein [Gilliamella sp. Pra-s60]MWN31792.1 hypothetical protein [Gilliamella sp. Pra-s60]